MACAECFPCLALPKIPQSSSFLSWKPFEGRTRKTTWGKLVLDSSASLIDAQTHSLIPTFSHLLHSSSPTNILTLSFSHVHTHTHSHTHTRTHFLSHCPFRKNPFEMLIFNIFISITKIDSIILMDVGRLALLAELLRAFHNLASSFHES